MSKNHKIIVIVLLCVLLIGIASAAVLIITANSREHNAEVDGLESINDKLESEGERLVMTVDELEAAKSALEAEVAELTAKLEDAGKTFSDEIAALEAEITQKTEEIAALEADIAKYRTVFNIDVRAQAKLIDEIVEYIENECPYVRVTTIEDEKEVTEWVLLDELIDEEREKLTPEEPLFTPEELAVSDLSEEELTEKKLRERVLAREDVSLPSVSVYYEDLATGYHFAYNADQAYNSASVIKAPYVMSVLEAIAADEKRYLDSLAENNELPEQIDTDDDGKADKIKIEYSNEAYDLSETIVYNKATMYKSGSGEIANMPDGTEFTYLDFVKYTLEYSDNVAYAQLRDRFGYSTMTALANRVGAKIPSGTMTAEGAGKLFKEIYKFIERDETYGEIMRLSMSKANHTVIIPAGVSPTKTLHKYGWDTESYHDAAIVLHADKPYVLAVFSDLDKGGNEINAYLREIVKMIDKLHEGFYNS